MNIKFEEKSEGAFRYYADCSSEKLIDGLEAFTEGRRYEFQNVKDLSESNYRLRCEIQSHVNAKAEAEFNERQFIARLKELEAKLKIAVEALEEYSDLHHAPKLEEALKKIRGES